jgi:hypothetical protein
MTRRSSMRAQAQEFYGQMVEDERAPVSARKNAPDPSPSQASRAGGGEITDLTARARALYEGSAVPVREIARLAGVSERTLYKYVDRYGWKRRYRVVVCGEAAVQANRGRGWQATAGFAPVKGAGGRFVRHEDASKPFAVGLKALDPAAQAHAAAACSQAQQCAHRAEADALAQRWADENSRAIQAVLRARDDLAAHDAAWGKKPAWSPAPRNDGLCIPAPRATPLPSRGKRRIKRLP